MGRSMQCGCSAPMCHRLQPPPLRKVALENLCCESWEGILPTKLMSKIRVEDEKLPVSLILIRIRKDPYTVIVFSYMGSISGSHGRTVPADMWPEWVCVATYCWWWFVLDSFSLQHLTEYVGHSREIHTWQHWKVSQRFSASRWVSVTLRYTHLHHHHQLSWLQTVQPCP